MTLFQHFVKIFVKNVSKSVFCLENWPKFVQFPPFFFFVLLDDPPPLSGEKSLPKDP